MKSIGMILVCCLAGALVIKAQQAPAPDTRPTFRARTDLVQMDVSVLDKKRLPVRGLTAADFTVLEDGHARPVEAFVEVNLPDRVTTAEPTWSRDFVPDVATNRVSEDEGRLVVILMDRTIPVGLPSTTAREIATAAVNALGPGDVAAVVSTSGGVPQNFTSDRTRLLRAIKQKDWSTGISPEAQEIEDKFFADRPGLFTNFTDGRCLCGLCVPNAITGVAEALQDVTRRRKSLLFIGTDFVVQAAPQPYYAELGCALKLKVAREKMFTALNRSGLTVHSIDPSGLNLVGPTSQSSSTLRASGPLGAQAGQAKAVNEFLASQNNLRILPETTGGRTVTNTNAPESRIPDIMRESQSYYLLGFRPADGGASGQFHSIKVVVNRPDVSVHSRSGYVTPEMSSAQTAVAASSSTASQELRASLTSTLPDASVALDLNAAVFATTGPKIGLVTLAMGVSGFAPAADAGGAPSPLEIEAAAYDAGGQPHASGRQTLQLAWPPEGSGPARRVDALSRLELSPGDYELRVAVSGAKSMRTASVFTYVTVPRFDQLPLSLSSIVLGATSTTSSVPADFFKSQLPIVPTAQREFGRSDSAVGFMRIYQGTGRTDAIQPVQVHARVLDAKGQPAIEQRFVLGAEQFAAARTGECRITLPLSRLAVGDYLLAVDVAMGERTAGRAVRFRVGS